MEKTFSREDYEQTAHLIRTRISRPPRIGLILGSGLNALAEELLDPVVFAYTDLPNFPQPGVAGHAGRLLVGTLEGHCVALLQGRAHFYEGVSIQQATFPVRVLQMLGTEILIVTNAAGGINPRFHVGDPMLITDHISLLTMAGFHPLRGPNDESLGPRFPDMSHVYDVALGQLAHQAAAEAAVLLQEGVYVGLAGPSFETPAELRFLRTAGADAVGMSTVAEVTVARHADMRVLGFSGISNIAILDPAEDRQASHQEVLDAGTILAPRMSALIRGVLRRLDH